MSIGNYRDMFGKAFFVVAGIGLILNVAFDLRAFTKNQDSDKLGAEVSRSLQVSLHLERLSNLLSKPGKNLDNPEVQTELDKLIYLGGDKRAAFEILKNGNKQSLQNTIEYLREIRESLEVDSIQKQKADIDQDASVNNEMMRTLMAKNFRIVVVFDQHAC